MNEKTEYTLIGFTVAYDWYNNKGFCRLIIETNEKGLKEIEKNPLQDFIQFGVQHVEYAEFRVYRKQIIETDKTIITVEDKEPFKTIKKGEYTLTEEEEEILFHSEPITVKV